MAKVRTQRHSDREKARKRTKSLFRKMNELAQIADAKIYFVMDRNGKYQIYKSTDQPGWPPSEQEMEKHSPIPRYKGPADFEPANRGARNQRNSEGTNGGHPTKPKLGDGGGSIDYQRRVFPVPKPPVLPRPPAGRMYLSSQLPS